ncbi:calcium-binding protein [Amylibacter sp. IMCC11727]|uniref:calcium-binding protein n=1 Tax=Amylibacter sp. IMCC11727 TaxID=3039851 RepID=UPI00244E1F8E|nr:calcium-binding protein [Amylibacter sp. IMCC11727]WGI20541.1 calcium-binding protein [Amylibacter sp. IMCC11727]
MTTTVVSTDTVQSYTLTSGDELYLTEGTLLQGHIDITSGVDHLVGIYGHLISSGQFDVEAACTDTSIFISSTGRVSTTSDSLASFNLLGTGVSLLNLGEIYGGYGIWVRGVGAHITNAGVIHSSSDHPTLGSGILLNSSDAEVSNSGTIVSQKFGVATYLSGTILNNRIDNSGHIEGEIAIRFENGSDFFLSNTGDLIGRGGTSMYLSQTTEVRNFGTITGDVDAVDMTATGSTLKLINGGLITGDINMGDGDDTYRGKLDGWTDGRVNAGDGADTLRGGTRDDDLRGDAGADNIQGKQGNDELYGGSESDMIRGNDGDDYIEGNQDNDELYGGRGNDEIKGGSGNDTITGGTGNDILSGNTGADVFVFGRNSGNDEITDFANNTDQLDLSAFAVSSRQDLTDAGAIIANGTGSIIDLTKIGGDGVILIEDMSIGAWGNSDFIFA